jgi:hypothetical protein
VCQVTWWYPLSLHLPIFSYPSLAVNYLLQGFLWYMIFVHSDYMPCPLQSPKIDKCCDLVLYCCNCDVWAFTAPGLYNDLAFHTPKFMSNCLCHSCRHTIFLSFIRGLSWGFETTLFVGWGCQLHAQSPPWRARISLFVWVITFDLSGMADPTISYASASIALRMQAQS